MALHDDRIKLPLMIIFLPSFLRYTSNTFVFLHSSAMDDATQNNSKLLNEQQKHDTIPYHAYPSITLFNQNPNNHFFSNLNNPMLLFSAMKFNELKNAAAAASFAASTEAPSWYCVDEESESVDSCSGVVVSGDVSDDEEVMSLVEYEMLYQEGNTKRKIEQLAAMVGVDTTDPAVVLSEVVRVLNHLKTI